MNLIGFWYFYIWTLTIIFSSLTIIGLFQVVYDKLWKGLDINWDEWWKRGAPFGEINWGELNILDIGNIILTFLRIFRWKGVMKWGVSLIETTIYFPIFLMCFGYNITRLTLTILLNADGDITISGDYLKIKGGGLIDYEPMKLRWILYDVWLNIWQSSQFFSFMIVYSFIKKGQKGWSWQDGQRIIDKITIRWCLGLPWYILIFSLKLAQYRIDQPLKRKKKFWLQRIIQVENFFTDFNCFMFYIHSSLFLTSRIIKIYVNDYKISTNGWKPQMKQHVKTNQVKFTKTGIWEAQIERFGKKTKMKHQVLMTEDSSFAGVFTSSEFVEHEEIKFKGQIFNRYMTSSGLKKQFLFFSPMENLIPNMQQNKFLPSIWENQGLEDKKNFIGWRFRTEFILSMTTTKKLLIQGDPHPKWIYFGGKIHSMEGIAKFAQENWKKEESTSLTTMKNMQTIKNFKSWFRLMEWEGDGGENFANISNLQIYEEMENWAKQGDEAAIAWITKFAAEHDHFKDTH